MAIIRENEFNRITAIYQRQAEECVRSVEIFYDSVTDLARRTCYAPLVNFANQIYKFYKEDLSGHLQREFFRWYNSEYSLHALARSIAAGNAAECRAREHMDAMGDCLRQMFRRGPVSISVDTSEPQIQDGDFDSFSAALSDCVYGFRRANEEAMADIRAMADENNAVECIAGFVRTTGVSLADSFQAMIREVEDGLGFFRSGVSRTLNHIPETGRGTDLHLPWGSGIPFL